MLISAVILSRYLSVSNYGSYQQLIVIYGTLLTIVSFGLPQSINYFLPRSESPGEKKAYVFQTYFLLLGLSLMFVSALFLSSKFISKQFNNEELSGLLKLFAWFVFFLIPIQFVDQLLVVLDKTKKLAVYRLSFACLRLLSIVVPVLMKANLKTIISFLVGFSVIQFVVTTFILFKPFVNIKYSWQRGSLVKQLRYSTYIGMSSFVGVLTRESDKIIVSLFFLPASFAVYANGAREIPFIGIITGSVIAILVPEFVKLYKEKKVQDLLELWHLSIVKVAVVLFPIAAFLFLFAREFMVTLFSPKYLASTKVFRIYLLLVPLRVTTYGAILMSIGKTSILFRSSVYALLLNVMLNIMFIRTFGSIGPAIATVLVTYILTIYMLHNIRQAVKIRFLDIMPWRKLFKLMVICVLPLVLIVPLKVSFLSFHTKLLTAGMVYFSIYAFAVFKFKAVPIADQNATAAR
ncbi:oligosaccharide flippase family protein [bacterium]|nr:oligosaccharide flippase family protein [bacterium]